MKTFALIAALVVGTSYAGQKTLILDCKPDEGKVVTNFDPSGKFHTAPLKNPKAPEGTKKYMLFGDAIVLLEVEGKVLPPNLKENSYAKIGTETLYFQSGTDKLGAFNETINFIDWKPGLAKIQQTFVNKAGALNVGYTCKVSEK